MLRNLSDKYEHVDLTLRPTADQEIANKMSDYIKIKYPDYKKRGVFFHASYLAIPLDLDPTSTGVNPMHPDGFHKGNLYVWDDWYSREEGGMPFDFLNKDSTWKRDTMYTQAEKVSGAVRQIALFIKQ
jgi:hypothetical protein